MWKAGQWLSAAVGVPRETFFKRGAEVCWADMPCTQLPSQIREEDLGHDMLPLSTTGQFDQRGAK